MDTGEASAPSAQPTELCWTTQRNVGPEGHRCNRDFDHPGFCSDDHFVWNVRLILKRNRPAQVTFCNFEVDTFMQDQRREQEALKLQ